MRLERAGCEDTGQKVTWWIRVLYPKGTRPQEGCLPGQAERGTVQGPQWGDAELGCGWGLNVGTSGQLVSDAQVFCDRWPKPASGSALRGGFGENCGGSVWMC